MVAHWADATKSCFVVVITLDALINEVRDGFDAFPPLDRLTRAVDLAGRVCELGERLIGFYVDDARRAGATWSEIGERLGVSRQAVQKRYIPK